LWNRIFLDVKMPPRCRRRNFIENHVHGKWNAPAFGPGGRIPREKAGEFSFAESGPARQKMRLPRAHVVQLVPVGAHCHRLHNLVGFSNNLLELNFFWRLQVRKGHSRAGLKASPAKSHAWQANPRCPSA
jgi:hypothetical protein